LDEPTHRKSHNTQIAQVSTLDPKTQEYRATSVNLSLRSVLTVYETCQFRQDPASPNANTLFLQDVRIAAFGAYGVEKLIESAAIRRFRDNAWKGREGLQQVVAHMGEQLDATMAAATTTGKQALREVQERVDELGVSLSDGVREVKDSWRALETRWEQRGLTFSQFQ
jgi:hypothetical protein